MIDNGVFVMFLLGVVAMFAVIVWSVNTGAYEEHQQCIEDKIIEYSVDHKTADFLCRRNQ